MNAPTEVPVERLRNLAEPPGWTDLNSVLPRLLDGDPSWLTFRCELMPLAQGAVSDWEAVLQSLLLPVLEPPASGRRYVHLVCQEDTEVRECCYRLTLRTNDLEPLQPDGEEDPDLLMRCGLLGLRLLPPPPFCLFSLRFPGKQI